ncbi:MAG: FAD-binding oxidoreductase [Coriobacteriales bacterium]|nr:FAD-binding oxidoreductase [Coriobacteriales bacterium]
MVEIKKMALDYLDFLRDESRSIGEAESISFPVTEEDVCDILSKLSLNKTPVTIQGGRTGLAAGAVPHGGHVLNLTKMNRITGLYTNSDDSGHLRYILQVQPGVVLSQMRKDLEDKNISTTGWSQEAIETLESLYAGPEHFFPTDPTEISATVGGMVACNASGARTYYYGPIRPHVFGIRMVLANGDIISLKRGEVFAQGQSLTLTTLKNRTISVSLPSYQMPHVKNASGYFAAPDIDAIDLIIGSDGTLGVITQIDLELLPLPQVIWGVSCFFTEETQALDFTVLVRNEITHAAALEFFDDHALDILRSQKEKGGLFASLPAIDPLAHCCVYVDLHCNSEEEAYSDLYHIGELLSSCGASEHNTWAARTALDKEAQRFFRHAVPESVNMLIDERRQTNPSITKLGSDMSVPNDKLYAVIELYRSTLKEAGLESAAWGHIGNNHLHVNVLPNNMDDYALGKKLFASWAATVTSMGGAVSAEHGVGKLKRDFLITMYGEDHIREMIRTKLAFDPQGLLARGNLFSEAWLDEEVAK